MPLVNLAPTEFQAMTGAQTSVILPGPILMRFLCLLDCLKRPQILTIHLSDSDMQEACGK